MTHTDVIIVIENLIHVLYFTFLSIFSIIKYKNTTFLQIWYPISQAAWINLRPYLRTSTASLS